MLKFYRSVLAAGVVALGLAACGDDVTVAPPGGSGGVTSVIVAPSSATVTVGGTITLTASVTADSGKTAVSWKSSDNTVATVDGNGNVTGVKPGSVTIVATSTTNTAISGAAAVTVVSMPSGINSFSLTPTSLTLSVGQTAPVVANISTASGVTAPTQTWISRNPSVATVSSSGVVTAVAAGSAVISDSINVGGVPDVQSIPVTVTAVSPATVSIAAINQGASADNTRATRVGRRSAQIGRAHV